MNTRGLVAVAILLSSLPSAVGGAEAQAGKSRLLMLIAEGVNGNEFMVPYEVGRAAGYEFDLAGPAKVTLLEKNAQRGAPVATVKLLLDDVKDSSPYAGIVIPGGGSPAMDAYARGAVVVVLGYDGSRMAGLDACKGLSFACPVHAGSKFAGKPGKMAGEKDPALKTQDRMYSAQGPAAVGELLRILEKDGIIGTAK